MLKKICTVVLLAFVAISLISLALGRSQKPAAPANLHAAPQLVAFYFHGNKRCVSCNEIERLTRAAWATEIEAGTLAFRPTNVDQAGDAHFVTDFQLTMRTVVLAEEAGGRILRFQRLDSCWELFKDPVAFTSYLRTNLQSFRSNAAPP